MVRLLHVLQSATAKNMFVNDFVCQALTLQHLVGTMALCGTVRKSFVESEYLFRDLLGPLPGDRPPCGILLNLDRAFGDIPKLENETQCKTDVPSGPPLASRLSIGQTAEQQIRPRHNSDAKKANHPVVIPGLQGVNGRCKTSRPFCAPANRHTRSATD